MVPALDDMRTMDPPPAALIAGTARRTQRNAPVRLTSRQRRKSSTSMSSTGAAGPAMPALLMRMSRPPRAARASVKRRSTAAGAATSATAAPMPACAAVKAATAAASTSPIKTLAPAAAKRRATCAPMPLAAAVTMTRLPSIPSYCMRLLCQSCRPGMRVCPQPSGPEHVARFRPAPARSTSAASGRRAHPSTAPR